MMLKNIRQTGHYLGQSLRLMVGLPDYGVYLQHRTQTHPEEPVLSYEDFFRERQNARYANRGRVSCC